MEKFLKKFEELKEKYKDVPTTYKWHLQNKCDIFNDLMTLKELYEQTDEYKQEIEKQVEERTKNFVNIHDLGLGDKIVFKFKNGEYIKK